MGLVAVKLVVVHNPHSGSALSVDKLRHALSAHDIELEDTIDITTEFPDKLTPYVAQGNYIAAFGGDGTQNAVAQYVYNTSATLVPLPGGTLNNFTKDLGIPQSLDDALSRLVSLQPRQVDIGSVNGQVFVNNSSIGFYPSSLRVREAIGSRIGKWPAATLGMLHALIKFKLYTVTMEGETFKTPFIFIGNNEYPLEQTGRRPSLTTGKLCAYAIAATNRRTLVKLAYSALRGNLSQQDEFIVHHDTDIVIRTRRTKVTISTDGEVARLSSPLTYRSEASSLRILG